LSTVNSIQQGADTITGATELENSAPKQNTRSKYSKEAKPNIFNVTHIKTEETTPCFTQTLQGAMLKAVPQNSQPRVSTQAQESRTIGTNITANR
jgi:hypothetical protein